MKLSADLLNCVISGQMKNRRIYPLFLGLLLTVQIVKSQTPAELSYYGRQQLFNYFEQVEQAHERWVERENRRIAYDKQLAQEQYEQALSYRQERINLRGQQEEDYRQAVLDARHRRANGQNVENPVVIYAHVPNEPELKEVNETIYPMPISYFPDTDGIDLESKKELAIHLGWLSENEQLAEVEFTSGVRAFFVSYNESYNTHYDTLAYQLSMLRSILLSKGDEEVVALRNELGLSWILQDYGNNSNISGESVKWDFSLLDQVYDRLIWYARHYDLISEENINKRSWINDRRSFLERPFPEHESPNWEDVREYVIHSHLEMNTSIVKLQKALRWIDSQRAANCWQLFQMPRNELLVHIWLNNSKLSLSFNQPQNTNLAGPSLLGKVMIGDSELNVYRLQTGEIVGLPKREDDIAQISLRRLPRLFFSGSLNANDEYTIYEMAQIGINREQYRSYQQNLDRQAQAAGLSDDDFRNSIVSNFVSTGHPILLREQGVSRVEMGNTTFPIEINVTIGGNRRRGFLFAPLHAVSRSIRVKNQTDDSFINDYRNLFDDNNPRPLAVQNHDGSISYIIPRGEYQYSTRYDSTVERTFVPRSSADGNGRYFYAVQVWTDSRGNIVRQNSQEIVLSQFEGVVRVQEALTLGSDENSHSQNESTLALLNGPRSISNLSLFFDELESIEIPEGQTSSSLGFSHDIGMDLLNRWDRSRKTR